MELKALDDFDTLMKLKQPREADDEGVLKETKKKRKPKHRPANANNQSHNNSYGASLPPQLSEAVSAPNLLHYHPPVDKRVPTIPTESTEPAARNGTHAVHPYRQRILQHHPLEEFEAREVDMR